MTFTGSSHSQRGYLVVLFVVILAFAGVAAAMQVLVLTSVATTSRAYDGYRQSAAERHRLEAVVTEALYDHRQIRVGTSPGDFPALLQSRLQELSGTGASVATETCPASVPLVAAFPNLREPVPALQPRDGSLDAWLSPEFLLLAGDRVAAHPELRFEFLSTRDTQEPVRQYRVAVAARLIAVPLTRYPVAAYELPAEIGTAGARLPGPASALPAGLATSRDPSWVGTLQAVQGTLPYAFRRRAALASAYQYVFSQSYLNHVAEYAGITHFHQLGSPGTTAVLAGMSTAGTTTRWDLALAGVGSYGTVSMAKDAAVVFSQAAGATLRLTDSGAGSAMPALLLVVAGPSDARLGPLTLELDTLTRPVVLVGYNVRLVTTGSVSIAGAVMLDPASSVSPESRITAGHFSYWAGSGAVPQDCVITGPLPQSAEHIAPRVMYVATRSEAL